MMIDGKQMTMDAAIIKAGSNGSQMYEIMMDEKTVRVELDILYPMEVYMEMRKVRHASILTDQYLYDCKQRRKLAVFSLGLWPYTSLLYEMLALSILYDLDGSYPHVLYELSL